MGRKPRVEFTGAIYHVIKRGNNRAYIFEQKEDKEVFLDYLQSTREESGFNLLGYVIMDNHYHLILETSDKPLHKIMQRLNNQFSRNYNKRYHRSDHVFGGRYKGILVTSDRYLLSLLRYIHNNPVRAKICKNIDQYNWSSDHCYRSNKSKWVHIDKILNIFSDDRQMALEEYASFMDQKEPIITAKAFYEEGETVGEEKQSSKAGTEDETLDDILRKLTNNKEAFQLIKTSKPLRSQE